MNRGLFGFLVFLGIVVLGLAVAAYVLGPNRLSFIFHAERRTEPVVIVELLEFDNAEHEQAYLTQVVHPAAAMVRALGGERLWRASVGAAIAGEPSAAWSLLGLVRYPSRAAFIELVTSGEYRALRKAGTAAVEHSAILAATPLLEFDAQRSRFHAVRMLAAAHDDSIDDYAAKWLAQDQQMLQRHGGELTWRARLSPLVADVDERFDEIQIYGFNDAEQRRGWATDARRQTLQTLQRRLFRRDVLLFVDARADADVQPIAPASDLSTEPVGQAPAEPGTLDKPN